MASKNLIKNVIKKNEDGTLDTPIPFGATFSEVIDSRSSVGKNFTLSQFYDNYDSFMNSAIFTYRGPNTPTNTHVGIWIDTSETNQDAEYLN